MRKVLLVLFSLSFFAGNLFADIFPREPHKDFTLQIEFWDHKKDTSWFIIIIPSGKIFMTPFNDLDLDSGGKQISPDEVAAFWQSAERFFNTFNFEKREYPPGIKTLSISLYLSSAVLCDTLTVQKRIGNLKEESDSIKNLISLCNRYLPEEYKVK